MASSMRSTRVEQPARSPKRPPRTPAQSAKKRGRRGPDSKVVKEFIQWTKDNAAEIGKWARANTKKLTGKEVI
jgi:hypothetical protein